MLGEPPRLLLREQEPPVRADIELAVLPGRDRRVEAGSLQLGRETRGPLVVAASDGAVEDLDAHAADRTRGLAVEMGDGGA